MLSVGSRLLKDLLAAITFSVSIAGQLREHGRPDLSFEPSASTYNVSLGIHDARLDCADGGVPRATAYVAYPYSVRDHPRAHSVLGIVLSFC